MGANCGTSLESMEQVMREYREAQPDMPLWIKPNAGLPRLVDGVSHYDVTPEMMGQAALEVRQDGRAGDRWLLWEYTGSCGSDC